MNPICFIICINYCILFSKHISCCFLFSQFLTSLLITFSISGVFWHSVIIWHLSTILHQYFIILSYLKRPIYYRASTLHFKLSPTCTFHFLYARSLRFMRVLSSNFVRCDGTGYHSFLAFSRILLCSGRNSSTSMRSTACEAGQKIFLVLASTTTIFVLANKE